VYHAASDANLPEEENRAYFASPEEAEAAGYRAAGQAAEAL
jgi:methylphosphotriester-DNA--protein-cysteine methyltransferase